MSRYPYTEAADHIRSLSTAVKSRSDAAEVIGKCAEYSGIDRHTMAEIFAKAARFDAISTAQATMADLIRHPTALEGK